MATVFLFKLDNFKNEFLANFQQIIETVTILKCEDGIWYSMCLRLIGSGFYF